MSKHLIKVGTNLTIAKEIFSDTWQTILEKGQVVEVTEVITQGGFIGKKSGIYYPEYISAVKIKGHLGAWYNTTFVEPFL